MRDNMNDKLYHEVFKPVLLEFLKNKKAEMEAQGLIPTLEALIEDLENE